MVYPFSIAGGVEVLLYESPGNLSFLRVEKMPPWKLEKWAGGPGDHGAKLPQRGPSFIRYARPREKK